MKKLFFVVLALIGLVAALPAEELWLGEVPFVNLKEDSNDKFIIKYNTDKNEYYINISDWLMNANIILTNEQFESLQKTITKVQEWCKIAHEKNAEIDKEIPDSKIEAKVEWTSGVNKYRNASWDKLNLQFMFSSLEGKKSIVPLLFLSAPKITSSYSEDINFRFPTALLSENEINKFMDVISQKNLENVLKKHEESKKAEEFFN